MLRLSQIRQLLAEAIQEIGLRRNLHDPEHAAYREMALMDLQEAHRRVIAAAACLEKAPPQPAVSAVEEVPNEDLWGV